MSHFTDALEPTKKGVLTKARENYEQPTTLRGLLERVKAQNKSGLQKLQIDDRNTYERPEITKFKELYKKLMADKLPERVIKLCDDPEWELSQDFKTFVIRTTADWVLERDWEKKLILYHALKVIIAYFENGRYRQ